MKNELLVILLFVFVCKLSGQTAYDETESIVNLPSGIIYQSGPGDNNTKNWTYPYSTKLTINGGIFRNFELSTTGKENEGFIIRQFNQTTNAWTAWRKIILDDGNGNIGIGTDNPKAKLSVNGTIISKEIKVLADISQYPDFVFSNNYKIRSLKEVEKYIEDNNHLPDIPKAEDMKDGIALGEMNTKLLQKIEELTLYVIDQNKKIIELEKQNNEIEELKQMVKLQNEKIAKLEVASK